MSTTGKSEDQPARVRVCAATGAPPAQRGRPPSAAFVLPQAERLQHRLVIELKQTGRSVTAVLVLEPVPRRRHEGVAGLPRQHVLADATLAAPLDHVEDPARGPTVAAGALTRAQPLRLRAHRRQ